MAQLTITFLGHASFRFESERGTVSYFDPWLDGNPTATLTAAEVDKADIVLATHGHVDHIGDCYEICRQTGAAFVGHYELCEVATQVGVAESAVRHINPGGSVAIEDVEITMTQAHHSHSLSDHVLPRPLPEGVLYHAGGAVGGYVMAYDNGITVYDAGDTCLFSDMQLISQMYGPQVAILPVGGKFTMGVREGARRRQPDPRRRGDSVPLQRGARPAGRHRGTDPAGEDSQSRHRRGAAAGGPDACLHRQFIRNQRLSRTRGTASGSSAMTGAWRTSPLRS